LPIDAASIEQAIGLNGVAVRANLQAFRYGRLWVHDRDRISRRLEPEKLSAGDERGRRPGPHCDPGGERPTTGCGPPRPSSTRKPADLLAVRLAELLDFQNERYARGYLETVLAIAVRERDVAPHAYQLTHAANPQLYKLMAYKDEYEVARLYLKPDFAEQISATFTDPVKVVNHLQPPAARRFGARKIPVGPWFRPVVPPAARRSRAPCHAA